MEIANATSLSCLAVDALAPDGNPSVQITLVGTYTCAGEALGPVEIQEQDAFAGEPGASALTAASDLGWTKPCTDVLMHAEALAPGGRAYHGEVSLALGPIAKTVRVTGDRVWKKKLFSHVIGDPQPFATLPLTWQRAYGGALTTRTGTAVTDERNPVGVGLVHPDSEAAIAGSPLPNIEHPLHLLRRITDRPPPVGFAPLCAHWQPRRGFAGTYDERWSRTRAPLLPVDFDPRFLQCAPHDQIAPGRLIGDEDVVITGIAPLGAYRFALPGRSPLLVARSDAGSEVEFAASLQTIVLRPADDRIRLTWRIEIGAEARLRSARVVEARAMSAGAA